MNKVILYGVASVELRAAVEHFLAEDIEIVGYSDSFHREDILQGKRFIACRDIVKEQFDFVILLSSKEDV